MINQLLLLQLLAHILADFIFQPHSWTLVKQRKTITWFHLWHVLVVFSLSYLLSFDFGFLKFALVLSALHLGIDVLKSFLHLKTSLRKSSLFFIDQVFHIVTLVAVCMMYDYLSEINFEIDLSLKQIAVVIAFTFCAKPSNIIIKNIFDHLKISTPAISSDNQENYDLPNAGKLIGIMERFLVLALILVNQFSAVGLIIAAKSILRFRDNKKNEYILVGTLLSFGIAILLGIVITRLL